MTITFSTSELESLKHALNKAAVAFADRAETCPVEYRAANERFSAEAGALWSKVYDAS
jgi:hypothetical protein